MWPQANGVVLTESLNLRQVTLRTVVAVVS